MPDGNEVAAILAAAAAQSLDEVFPWDDAETADYVNRVRCLAQWMPELELPSFDAAGLQAVLPQVCQGCRSLDELRKAPWLAHLQAALTQEQQRALAREAPQRIEVPSGSRIRLHYEPGKPPVLAVRIQEIFGMLETPRVAGRRVPVLLHLLAAQSSAAAGDRRPGQLLADHLSSSPQGPATPLSQARLAGRSLSGPGGTKARAEGAIVSSQRRDDRFEEAAPAFIPALPREAAPTQVDEEAEPVAARPFQRGDDAAVGQRLGMIEAQPSLGNVLADHDHVLAARGRAVLAHGRQMDQKREGVTGLSPALDDHDLGIKRAQQAPDLGANVVVGGCPARARGRSVDNAARQ